MVPTLKNQNSFNILITGGSNSALGISSEQITKITGKSSHNLSIIPSEGEGIIDYADWVKQLNITTNIVIYSSMNFWYLNENLPKELKKTHSKENFFTIKNPAIRNLNALTGKNPSINSFGDITYPICDKSPIVFSSSYANTNTINKAALDNLINTTRALKTAVKASKIYLRIPPILIAASDEPKFIMYINSISDILENNGITIKGKKYALTKDPKMMCIGSNHPTPDERNRYTSLLIEEINNQIQPHVM